MADQIDAVLLNWERLTVRQRTQIWEIAPELAQTLRELAEKRHA
jgi:hypothetical protein